MTLPRSSILINYNLYFNFINSVEGKAMNGQKDYRIKNTKQSLPKMHASVVTTLSAPKGKQPVKYSDLIQQEKKDALLHTIIEEHMIKFGYLGAFDTFSRELLDKEAQGISPPKASGMVRKSTQSLRLTDIKQEILKVGFG